MRHINEDNELRTLLRMAPEPLLCVDDMEVHRLLVDRFELLRERMTQKMREMPDAGRPTRPHGIKEIYQVGDSPGDFRIMAYDDGCDVTVKLIGTNEASTVVHDKISVGKFAVIHPMDHHVMGLLDVCALSSVRTAMGVLLAYLASGLSARPRLGVVGAGRIGTYCALAFQRAGLIDSCACADPSHDTLQAAARICALEQGPSVRPTSLPDLLNSCDVVVLATNSPVPILGRQEILKHGLAFIASVGADADTLSELRDDVPGCVQLIAGSPLCTGLGDLKRWRRHGLVQDEDLIYLHQLIARPSLATDKPVCYVSTGFPFLDHVAGLLAYEAARDNRVERSFHELTALDC